MYFRYHTKKLQNIIHALSTLTGISMAFLDVQQNYLCKCVPNDHFCAAIQKMDCCRKCALSDSVLLSKCSESHKFEYHICHAGLYDACMPIIKDQAIAGYVLMGQIRHPSSSHLCIFENTELEALYQNIPIFTDEQLESIQVLLPEVLFQTAIQFDDSTYEITQYIKNHMHEPLTLDSICGKFHISKNSLYHKFRDAYNSTVTEYVTKLRIDTAQKLLRETTDPVYLIADKVGVNNYTYFCRLFKRHTGLTPGQYRNSIKGSNIF